MKTNKFTIAGIVAVLLIAGTAWAISGHVIAVKALLRNGLRNIATGSTLLVDSDTADATTSGTVAAVTVASTVNVTDGDLVLNVENSAGDNLLTVDEQGLLTALTDAKLAGNDLTCSGTGATCKLTSDTNDATTSTTVAAITLAPSVNVTANDLVVEVNDSAGTSLLTCDEEGDIVALGDVSLAGNDINGTGTGATLLVKSSTADATTSSTVAAVTMQCGADITAADLCMELNDSAGAELVSVTEAGNMKVLGSVAIGAGTAIAKVVGAVTAATDIGNTAANQTTVGTVAVTGAALGNACIIAPVEDDGAWDNGVLACFVESAGNVKWQFHADADGADPAATNTYRITLLQF